MPNKKIIILNDANFEREVFDSTNMLVQFWAPWSPPCSLLSPIVDTIADEFYGKIIVGRLDIEVSPMVIDQYRVRYVPTLILFEKGREIYRKTGAVDESTLSSLIQGYFGISNS